MNDRSMSSDSTPSTSTASQALGSGMGALPRDRGVDFRVWAPNAAGVSVYGSFNDWRKPGVPLAREDGGCWSGWSADAKAGDAYKFILRDQAGNELVKHDPHARMIDPQQNNSVIYRDVFDWQGDAFVPPALNELVIYELHVGTFNPASGQEAGGTFHSVIQRLPYLRQLGINAIELLPPTEFPGNLSWGYNPSHPFAVESSYGGPDGLKTLVREAHRHGIAVILDVVYNHFGPDGLDLWQFDGWSENGLGGIYFYNDWRSETPWGNTRPDYGRQEVRDYLRANARMWIGEFHADGLRLDAVSYIRKTKGEGNPESIDLAEGWQLLQEINRDMKEMNPRSISIAEDVGSIHAITAETGYGGAGFDSQWSTGFASPLRAVLTALNDDDRNLAAIVAILPPPTEDAFHRVIYSESHDENANGGSRLPSEIAPDDPDGVWARRRSLQGAALVLTTPGIPMLFEGQEFLEDGWFADTNGLDWSKKESFSGILAAYRDLISLRRNRDGSTLGLTDRNVDVFHQDHQAKVLAWHRWRDGGPRDSVVVVMNLGAREHENYVIPFPREGRWHVRFHADWRGYSRDFTDLEAIVVDAAVRETGPDYPTGGMRMSPYDVLILSQDE